MLDYGEFNDGAGDKFSVWSVTAICQSREQEQFDYFFDAPKRNGTGAKKDGQTGIFFLGDLLAT